MNQNIMKTNQKEQSRVVRLLKDIIKGFLIGIAGAAVLTLILFLAGMIFGSLGVSSGLETAKNGMLIVTALGLFIIAGMLLVKGKKPEKQMKYSNWKNHFSVIGFKGLLGAVSFAFLIVAEIIDRILIATF